MLAKANWFQKRKYTGWGINPKTWQGWVYIAGFICLVAIIQSLPFFSTIIKNIFSGILIVFFLVDTLKVMATLDKDELEARNEAIAERNAAWAMVLIITIGIVYPIISQGDKGMSEINPFLLATLVIGFIVKATSYFFLEKK